MRDFLASVLRIDVASPRALTLWAECYVALVVVVGFEVGFGWGWGRPRYYMVVCCAGVVLCCVLARRLTRSAVSFSLCGFVLLSVASLTWTESTGQTMLYLRTTVALLLVTLLVASAVPAQVIGRGFVIGILFALAITGITLLVGQDRVAAAAGETGWRGAFAHKNLLGSFCAFSIPWVLAFVRSRRKRLLLVAALTLFVVGSSSVTGLLAASAGLSMWFLLGRVQLLPKMRQRAVALALIAGLLLLSVVAIINSDVLAERFGRDATLTGRTLIWDAVATQVLSERPVTGYGPGSYFGGSETTAVATGLSNSLGYRVPHAHNGWLQLQVDLGIGGVVLMGCLFMYLLAKGVALVPFDGHTARWLVSCAVVLWIISIAEPVSTSGWLASMALLWSVAVRAKYTQPTEKAVAQMASW